MRACVLRRASTADVALMSDWRGEQGTLALAWAALPQPFGAAAAHSRQGCQCVCLMAQWLQGGAGGGALGHVMWYRWRGGLVCFWHAALALGGCTGRAASSAVLAAGAPGASTCTAASSHMVTVKNGARCICLRMQCPQPGGRHDMVPLHILLHILHVRSTCILLSYFNSFWGGMKPYIERVGKSCH